MVKDIDLTEEAYTSKCSFLDQEMIGYHKEYKGKRVHRGLYQSSHGRCINADVNGSFNIMRKYLERKVAWNNPIWLDFSRGMQYAKHTGNYLCVKCIFLNFSRNTNC